MSRTPISYVFILIASLFLSNSLRANEMLLEIVPLQHRLSSDVIPILRPLLSQGGTLTGMHNQLIIKTDPENLAEIIRTLEVIDKPIRSLKISVRYDTQGKFQDREDGIDGHYQTKNVQIDTRNPGSYYNDGVIVSRRDKKGNEIRYRHRSTDSKNNDNSIYFVRSIEGQPAWIRSGESSPVNDRTVVHHPYGTDIYDSMRYQEINSGFYVIPRLNGNRVTLHISPQQQRRHTQQSYRSSGVETTVSGILGRWIDLGGVNEQYDHRSSDVLYKTRSSTTDFQNIQVKVEEVR